LLAGPAWLVYRGIWMSWPIRVITRQLLPGAELPPCSSREGRCPGSWPRASRDVRRREPVGRARRGGAGAPPAARAAHAAGAVSRRRRPPTTRRPEARALAYSCRGTRPRRDLNCRTGRDGGNLTVGSNFTVASQTAGTYTAPGDSAPTGLLVGGSINWSGSNSGGTVSVGSSADVNVGNMTDRSSQQREQPDAHRPYGGQLRVKAAGCTGDRSDAIPSETSRASSTSPARSAHSSVSPPTWRAVPIRWCSRTRTGRR